jgi:hypothetical protein
MTNTTQKDFANSRIDLSAASYAVDDAHRFLRYENTARNRAGLEQALAKLELAKSVCNKSRLAVEMEGQ